MRKQATDKQQAEMDLVVPSSSEGGSPTEPPSKGQGKGAKASGKRKHKTWLIARRIVQTAALLLFCLPLILTGWTLFGLTTGAEARIATPAELPFYGSLSSSSLAGFNLADPYAALQTTFAAKEFIPELAVAALPLLLLYTLIRARAFCGWVCPVNFILEGVDFLRRKLGIRVQERVMPRRTKVVVAAGILLVSALVSMPVFEAFSPISFINKGILVGSTVGLVSFIAIVVIELFWGHRVWCRSLCPVGGFYEVLGRLGLANVHIKHEACIECGLCQEACLANPEILDPALNNETQAVLAGDCMLCGACVDSCPTKALAIKLSAQHYLPQRTNEKAQAHK